MRRLLLGEKEAQTETGQFEAAKEYVCLLMAYVFEGIVPEI